MAKAKTKQIKITLKKSTIGSTQKQIANVRALGLRKINSFTIQNDTPQIQGMLKVVGHLVQVEEVEA